MCEFSLLDSGCTCFQGNPPCTYCVDTLLCESCSRVQYADSGEDHKKHGIICEDCSDFYAPREWREWARIILAWILLIIWPPLWVAVFAIKKQHNHYKKDAYLVPCFFIFFYEFAFTRPYYIKTDNKIT